jgi:hypothetical protein
MTPVVSMVLAAVGSMLVAVSVFGTAYGVEIVAGLLGPLLATSGSWVVAHRTFRTHPEELTAVMIKGFIAKLVFFGAYVAIAIKGAALRPLPFVVSFTAYFIALYLIEALALRQMFAADAHTRGHTT